MHRGMAGMVLVALTLFLPATGPAGPLPLRSVEGRPVVVRADVDRVERDRLVIRGRNFGTTRAPVVLLSGVPLEVLSFSDDQIVVRLPVDAPAARYRLQVLAHGTPSPVVEVVLGQQPPAPPEG
jgi:IPT/TIG domain